MNRESILDSGLEVASLVIAVQVDQKHFVEEEATKWTSIGSVKIQAMNTITNELQVYDCWAYKVNPGYILQGGVLGGYWIRMDNPDRWKRTNYGGSSVRTVG